MTSTTTPTATAAGILERSGLWPVRAVWFLLPLLAGPGLLDTVDGRSTAVAAVVQVAAWVAWFVGMVSTLAPSTATLTALRVVAPAAFVGPLVGAVTADLWTTPVITALAAGALAFVVVLMPSTGDPMINGSSYGPERRMALRPPASVLLGPIQLVWLIVFAGVMGGPLLLAAERWLLGVPALVIGGAFAYLGVRSLHQLSRRWVVFVPAGLVLHDYWSLAESVMVMRSGRPTLGPADPAADGTSPVDLSAGARGVILSLRLTEPLPAALRKGRTVETVSGSEFWFAPTLPGRVVTEARTRAITIA